jgi:membrane protease YdiL (CAAX protease family)
VAASAKQYSEIQRDSVTPLTEKSKPPVSIATWVFVLFGLGVPILPYSIAIHFIRRTFGLEPMASWALVASIDKLLVLFLFLLAIVFWEGRPLKSVGLRRPAIRDATLGLPIFVLCELVGVCATVAIASAMHHPGWSAVLTSSVAHRKIAQMRLLAIPLSLALPFAVINGILEELAARGFAIERLHELTGSTLIAATIALIADVAAHIPYWGIVGAIEIAPMQLVFVLVYLWRRDLMVCIAGHIMCDAFPFLLLFALSGWMAVPGNLTHHTIRSSALSPAAQSQSIRVSHE